MANQSGTDTEESQQDPPVDEDQEAQDQQGKTHQKAEASSETLEEYKQRIQQLKDELDAKQTRIEELEDHLKQLQADFENYKRRQKETQKDELERKQQEVIRQFIPIYDNLDRAFKAYNNNGDRDSFIEGIERIYAQFDEVLSKNDIQPIDAVGQQFDPQLHEALMRVESEEHEHNEILEEFERGYTHAGEVMKPSKVKVNIIGNNNHQNDKDE